MNAPFFITGLPRSRTAWLANLFTHGSVACAHDLLGKVVSWDTYIEALRAITPVEHVSAVAGDSDSGLVPVMEEVMRRFPLSQWILVDRPFEDSWHSLQAMARRGELPSNAILNDPLQNGMRKHWKHALDVAHMDARCLVVDFAALDSTGVLETLWVHCFGGVRFDRGRAIRLQEMRISVKRCDCSPAWLVPYFAKLES